MKEIKLFWLSFGALIVSIAMSFIWPLTSVYLHNDLHISLTSIGIVLLANSLASVLGSYLGGYCYDRFNPYHLVIAGVSATTAVTGLLIPFHGWPLYAVLLVFLGICGGFNTTLVNSIGTSIKSQDTRYVFNILYFTQNLGVVLGTSLVGFVYGISVTLLFIVAAILSAVFLIVVIFRYKPASLIRHAPKITKATGKLQKQKLPRPNFIIICSFFVALFLIWIMYQQWVSNLSVYMTSLGIPLKNYSFLWTINAGGIVILQIVINWVARYYENLIGQIFFGIAMVAISFIVLIFVKAYVGFVIAMIILTLGEATAFPTIPALVNEMTPVQAKGFYQGQIMAWASAGRAVGPLFGGIVIESISYGSLFIVAGITVSVVLIFLILIWSSVQGKLKFYR